MLKKAFWVYLGLAFIGVIYVVVNSILQGNTEVITIIFSLVFFWPVIALALELSAKKVPLIFLLFALLLVAVPVVGIFNFDGFNPVTIGKALLFVPAIAGLVYYCYRHIFRRKA